MGYIVYGRDISLFTRKLEAALKFYGIGFETRLKDDTNRTDLEHRAGTHQIPVVETPEGWMIADTTPILGILDARYPARRLFPGGLTGLLVHVIEEVLDEWVARVMVHYRWHYDENTQAVISALTGAEISIDEARSHRLAGWGLRACRATGTEFEAQQVAAEREYMDILAALEMQLRSTAYALGDRPSAVDAIILGGLWGHTNRDPSPDLADFPRVLTWSSANDQPSPEWGNLPDFPDTTRFGDHMLALARSCYAPYILANAKALKDGAKAFVCDTYGEEVSYLCRPYPERSRQMIRHRVRHQLSADERKQAQIWLEHYGLAECFFD